LESEYPAPFLPNPAFILTSELFPPYRISLPKLVIFLPVSSFAFT
jgi:hypothetical protein